MAIPTPVKNLLRLGAIGAGLLCGPLVQAAPFPYLDSSARGAALGGMMAALAADVDANLWNPAGLLWLPGREVAAAHADLFGLDLVDQTTVQFGWPIARKELTMEGGEISETRLPPPAVRAFGLFYSSLGAHSLSSTYRETQVGASYAWRPLARTQAGVSVRLLRAASGLAEVAATGRALDVGIQRDLGRFRLGIVVHDLISSVDWETGTDDPLPQRWHVGLAWFPHAQWRGTVEASWLGEGGSGSIAGGGVEWSVLSPLALRAALRSRSHVSGSSTEASAGAGVTFDDLRFDYAFLVNGHELGTTHRWSASLGL